MNHTEILVLGAGMAGCSVAFHTASLAKVTVIEMGNQVASEGAQQNAGLIRRLDAEPCDRALAQRTHQFLSGPAVALGLGHLSQQTGAVLGLARDPLSLHDARAHLIATGARVEKASPAHFPALRDSPIRHAWHLPDEWVTDSAALAGGLLTHAIDQGARLETGQMATHLIIQSGRCVGAMTAAGPISADITVLACGAWSGLLAAKAGLNRPLVALRRMAAIIGPDPIASEHHPWCWLDDVGLYAKPHQGGWMVSPCDEVPDRPVMGVPSTGKAEPSQWALLQHKLRQYLPALAVLGPTKSWTGLRTFCPDRRPMLGEDGECRGLYWAAGLGGSGVSSCIGVGEFIAAEIQGQDVAWLGRDSVIPNRPQLSRWPIRPDGDPQRAKLLSSSIS
jgi:D-arginine dehydrogenase